MVVNALYIPLLAYVERSVDKDFEKISDTPSDLFASRRIA